jgi:hypothetical protein
MRLSSHEWRSSASALPAGAKVFEDDWCFVDNKGDYHARLYHFSETDSTGIWHWRVWIDNKLYKGVCHTRNDARDECERLLVKHKVILSPLESKLFTYE